MIYVMTRAGHGRTVSEDAVLIGDEFLNNDTAILTIPYGRMICVADGVGGNNAGEVASEFVLKSLVDYEWSDNLLVKNKLITINKSLIDKSRSDSSLAGMATTLSGICICEDVIKLCHVGNTRIYVKQGHYLKQLTPDHTVYNWLKSVGRIEEAASCNRNEITNCFGGGDERLLEKLYFNTIKTAATLLITSDGIHEYVNIDDMEDIVDSDISNEEKCSRLRDAALFAGSDDDMTAVLVCLQEG